MLCTQRCANEVLPSGGPKDNLPPSLVAANPPVGTRNFSARKVEVEFSEFIQLNNVTATLIVSPFLKAPDVKVKGKSMVFHIPDSLAANTTYSFQFGDAIGDFTENNRIPGFNYVFSTGDFIDSLSLKGTITDSWTIDPVKEAWVMLYDTDEDSLPMKKVPLYIAKTDAKGHFAFKNLKSSRYKVFALVDKNSNYLYDLATETIGFSDTLVSPYFDGRMKRDTGVADTDSLVVESKQNVFPPIEIAIFLERDTAQKLLKSSASGKWFVQLMYKEPVGRFEVISTSHEDYILESNKGNDTLMLWLKWPVSDSVGFIVKTNGNRIDTLTYEMKAPTGKGRGPQNRPFRIVAILEGNYLREGQPLHLEFSDPIASFDTSNIVLFEDSLLVDSFSIEKADIPRQLLINYDWNPKKKYRVYIPDSSAVNIFDKKNDSTSISFSIRPNTYYGSINLTTKGNAGDQLIIYVLDEKGNTRREIVARIGEALKIPFLPPGVYKIKAVIDKNKNGRRDTGIYIEKLQPEQALKCPQAVTVRTNWANEILWDLNENIVK
ncbi:MAG: Ig-like domain-containing protein [Bacteroidetes bacterium]|nr:Ig-like domain-containing protein [Bacteroidota bacterium]